MSKYMAEKNLRVFKQPKWKWLLGILLFYFFCMFYTDIIITYDHGLILIDSIVEGKLSSFYAISAEGAYLDQAASYYIPIYLIFAVWNIPCWLLSRVGGIDPHSMICLLWAKGMVVFFWVGCVFFFRKLLCKLTDENHDFWTFMFCSSLLFALPVFANAQYDIVELFFALWGLNRASEEPELSWKTLLLLSLAVSIKLLMVFPIVLWVLVKEKRILYVIKDGLCLLVVLVASMLPFFAGFSSGGSGTFSGSMLLRLVEATIPAGGHNASIFFLIFFGACVIAYLWMKPAGSKDFLQIAVWVSAVHFAGFFLFVNAHPFWMVLMAPFMILLLTQNVDRLKDNLLIEFVFECAMMVRAVGFYYWVYLGDAVFSMLALKHLPRLKLLTGSTGSYGEMISAGLTETGTAAAQTVSTGLTIATILMSGIIVCNVALLVLNHPWRKDTGKRSIPVEEVTLIQRCTVVLRLLILVGFIATAMLIYCVL